jgi:hypothetical protein
LVQHVENGAAEDSLLYQVMVGENLHAKRNFTKVALLRIIKIEPIIQHL